MIWISLHLAQPRIKTSECFYAHETVFTAQRWGEREIIVKIAGAIIVMALPGNVYRSELHFS